jgi:Fe2+ or Zn2+ uptake regulation protein
MINENSLLVRVMGDHPSVRILDFLIDNKDFDYSKTDICEGANVSLGSLYKIWHNLEESGIVVKTRQYGATKLYRLNKENPLVKKLLEFDFELCKHYTGLEVNGVRAEAMPVPG